MTENRTHLLGLGDLSPNEIRGLLDSAHSFAEISERSVKKVPTLRGKTVVNLFLEPSTEPVSFELTAIECRYLVSWECKCLLKASLLDTTRTLAAYSPDIIVLR